MSGMRSYTAFASAALALQLSLITPILPVRSQEPAPTSAETRSGSVPGSAIEYRRIYVPESRPEEWPTGGSPYLPLAREEFERLIQTSEDRRELAAMGGVQIESAQYTATVADDGSLRGRAALRISLFDTKPRLLELAPLNVSVVGSHWAGAKAEASQPVIGRWVEGERTLFGVLVRNNGELNFEWAVAPTTNGVNLEYLLQLPVATASQLAVELPVGATASMTPGYLDETTAARRTAPTRRVFQLGPSVDHRLKIRLPESASARQESLPSVAVSESYQIRSGGLDFEAELQVQSPLPRSEMAVDVVGDLQVTEVMVDNRHASWRSGDDGDSKLIISLPETSLPATITIQGIAPTLLRDNWRLPSVRPDAASWREGTSTIWIDQTLELQSIESSGAQVVNAVGIGGSDGRGEAYRLQASTAGAMTTVILGERDARLHVDAGVTAEFADREVIATFRARLWAEDGALLQLSALIKPEWTPESVESPIPDDIVQWHVAEHGAQRRLYVQLRRSPTVLAPLQLTVTGRKPIRSWSRMATVEELSWLRMDGADVQSECLLVRDRNGGQVWPDRLDAAGLLEVSKLNAASRELLESPGRGLLLDLGASDMQLALRVPLIPARFDAEARLELLHSAIGFEHRATFKFRPTTGGIREFTLLAARPIPAQARWELPGSDRPPMVETVAVPAVGSTEDVAHRTDVFSTPAQYRVRLPAPQSEPFELRLSWRGSDIRRDSINALTIPEASSWQSWAILRGNASAAAIDVKSFARAAAHPAWLSRDSAPVLACVRLSDDPYSPPSDTPSMKAGVAAEPSDAAVTCWLQEIATLQFDDGRQTHRVVYHLQADASQRLTIRVPDGMKLTSAQLDGRNIAGGYLSSKRQEDESISVHLHSRGPGSRLVLELQGRRGALGSVAWIDPPQLKASFPILESRWTISAPAHFLASGGGRTSRDARDSWMARLFGPLVSRGAGANSGGDFMSRAGASERLLQPAAARGPSSADTLAPAGWTTVIQDYVGDAQSVRLTHVGSERALKHLAWLAAALGAAWGWSRKPRRIIGLAAVSALAALVLPANHFAWPQAVFLGLIAGVVVRAILSASQSAGSAASIRTVLVLVAAGAANVQGTPPASGQQSSVEIPPTVLYPVDSDGRPVGMDVYVPTPLLDKLLPSSPLSLHDGAAAVLVDANYRFVLSSVTDGQDVVCTSGTLRFRWRTFQPHAVVRLPLREGEARWLTERYALDGTPVKLAWKNGDCTVALGSPGLHELVLELAPHATRVAQRSKVKLQVPSFPGARLEIVHPAGAAVTAASAVVDRDRSQSTRTVARLADDSVLQFSWATRPPRDAETSIKVEQLTWLNVQPAVSTVDVRFELKGDLASLDKLSVSFPAELKLLPLPENSPVYELQSYPGATTVAEFRFRTPPQGPFTLPLQFQLQRSASLGRFEFPKVQIADVDTTVHHFVVTADPTLHVRDEPDSGLTPLTPTEVARRWSDLPPQDLRYAVGDAPRWSMRVEQVRTRFAASESLGLLCTANEVEVAYSAVVNSLEGTVLVHGVTIPPDLEIQDVSLQPGGNAGPAPVRWARPRAGHLQVFLGRPLAEPHTLRISGRLAYDDRRGIQAPRILLAGVAASPIAVAVNRTTDVLVDFPDAVWFNGPSGVTLSEQGLGGVPAVRFEMGRNDDLPPELTIRANALKVDAKLLLQLEPSPQQPVATCLLHATVTSGVADSLHLVVDKSWQDLAADEPGTVVIQQPLPYDASRQLVTVRLARLASAGEKFSLRLTGSLQLEADQRIRFPAVQVLAAAEEEMYLALPPAVGNQTTDWTLVGVQRSNLPADLAKAAGDTESTSVYQVERERFIAERRVFPDSLRRASVRMAYTEVAIDHHGDWSAVSELIVQPGGIAEWQLKLPDGAELLHAEVDGKTVTLAKDESGLSFPPSGSRYLPRLVTVAYRTTAEEANGQLRLSCPQVLQAGRPLKVDASLWQAAVEGTQWRSAGAGAQAISRDSLLTSLRAGRMTAALDASALALQLPGWESEQWFRPWFERVTVYSSSSTQIGDAREVAWASLADRLVGSATPVRSTRDRASLLPAMDDRDATCYESAGDGTLTLITRADRIEPSRWLLALAIVTGWGAARRFPQKLEPAIAWTLRQPLIIGVAAGLFWWVALWPKLLGPAIIGFALAAYFKLRQQRMQLAPPEISLRNLEHDKTVVETSR